MCEFQTRKARICLSLSIQDCINFARERKCNNYGVFSSRLEGSDKIFKLFLKRYWRIWACIYKFIASEDTLIDDYMKNNPSDEDSPMRPSTSQDAPKLALLQPPAPQIQVILQINKELCLNR